jgi:sugar phosphate isomerase/epimerase
MLLGPYGGFADAGFDGTVEQARERALAAGRRAIELAAALGAPYAKLFLGCPSMERWLTWHGTAATWADNVAEFASRVDPLLNCAEANRVRLLIEPHPKQVAYDAESLIALLDACGGRLEVCLDPANLLALGHDPVQVIRALPAPPAIVHAKDVERAAGGVPPEGPGWVRYGPQPAIRFRAVTGVRFAGGRCCRRSSIEDLPEPC